ncbi:cell division protein FtsA [Candidatus Aerophobetes bacterium]|uniref:Cell division protein FtsA n=1 Tax=Aerophobetes bacterium TaxID=2030807 RepID=A0A523QKP4_UNCAE|nr:MAG: cell division protein FtsA [Candidatus Aerophobetes bacterium]
MKDDLVVGLDIGTTKICALVARLNEEGRLDILGVGKSSSRGVSKGLVTDIEETSQAVKEAMTLAELDAGLKASRVWVSIAGDHILAQDSRGFVKITGEDRTVAAKDVEEVMKEASQLVLPPDREIIHVLAQRFLIDGQDLVKQPIGMKGTHLGVGVHVVTASSAWRGNIENCVRRAGYESEGVVLQSLASAMATVLPQEEDLGVVLVDIGGGTTDLAIFLREGLRFTRVIAVGGSHITNDIAVGLHTTREKAEEIKLKYGTLSSARVRGREKIRVERIAGRGSYTIERKDLVRIIDPRMEEIFELVEKELTRSGYRDLLSAGLILTGGTSLLVGVKELAEDQLGLPTKIGEPHVERPAELTSPIYATVVGLVLYGIKRKEELVSEERLGMRIKEWLKEFF